MYMLKEQKLAQHLADNFTSVMTSWTLNVDWVAQIILCFGSSLSQLMLVSYHSHVCLYQALTVCSIHPVCTSFLTSLCMYR